MKFTGNVLALDLATTTGWAYGPPGKTPAFGHVRFAKPGSTRPVHYRAFREWMETKWNVRDHQPDLVVYESAALAMVMQGRTNADTLKLLMGLCEHLEEWCHEVVELREASVAQVRAFFIGKNYKAAIAKPMTVEKCRAMGVEVTTDDEADAVALHCYQCAWLRPDIAHLSAPLFMQR